MDVALELARMKMTPLAPAALAQFKRDGFLLLRKLFTTREIDVIARWADELAQAPPTPGKSMLYLEDSLAQPGQRIVSRIENFCPFHEGFAALLDGEQLRGHASALLGEDAVLFKDKINFKMPGGDGFTSHQDVQAGWDRYASVHL